MIMLFSPQEPYASFDLRGAHGLSHDPMPLRDAESGHGTRCAGEVAMEANNSYCGVGIAYNARVGGIRLLDGPVTDAMEASALSFNSPFIDIYICSWGPRDDGAEMGGPAQLAEKALLLGTQKGRGGKGNIFVWASGNGGGQGDHCGADGYINSIYTIAIGGITHAGEPPSFSEPCPATMAVTLTGGNPRSLPMKPLMMFGQRRVTAKSPATVQYAGSSPPGREERRACGKGGRDGGMKGGGGGGQKVWPFSGEGKLELEIWLLALQWSH
ncbi:hypothetical protein ACEWY4_020352 [Coilia grayii]|uniref:Peptidase S8/S53 domain-containing protein n=1 Tax=Coilia grayii TaxID=363190 RepID=A0ABD1JDL4_9TELE